MNPLTERRVRQVVDDVRPFLTPDGGDVDLLSIDGDVVRVRYRKGHNEKCVECVMAPDEFREYMIEMFRNQVPVITDVQVEVG